MRFTSLLSLSALAVPAVWAADAAHWASEAARSSNGIITVDTAGYDALLKGENGERDYGFTIVMTAMKPEFKCKPCHDFEPVYQTVAHSWRKVKDPKRDTHFFAELDFANGQEVFQRLGLQSAPTVYYYPPTKGSLKTVATKGQQNYDLNRAGLGVENLHKWIRSTTPVQFDMYKPMSPVPFVIAPLVLALSAYLLWQARSILVPIITSRFIWGAGCIVASCIFVSGFMWVKIKQAPYVAASANGQINWIAGGYGNQYGLEGQVIAALYFVLSLCVVVLSVFIPAQSSPAKQRIGTVLWIAMLIMLFSILIRIFRMKNGGYPYHLL